MKRDFEFQIKMVQDAPRSWQVKRDFESKTERYEKAEYSEDLERSIPEIEMLKFVLFLVCHKS